MYALAVVAALALGAQQHIGMNELNRLVELRQAYEMVDSLSKQGYDVHSEANRQKILAEASGLIGTTATYESLVKYTGTARSPWQKFTGFFTFVHVCYITGAVLGTIALCWLFGLYFLAIILAIPVQLWELLLYGLCGWLIYAGVMMAPDYYLIPVLPGCLGLYGCFLLTQVTHFDDNTHWRRLQSTAFLLLSVVWGAVALYYDSHIIGFLSVGAFLAGLNFIIGVIPGVVYVGWQTEDEVPTATFAAGLILAAYIVLSVTGSLALKAGVFAEGAMFLGSLVYFLGILIMSSKWYKDGMLWPLMQIVCIGSGVLALWLGTTYGMSSLAGVGGTLFYLYLIEKYYEIPWFGAGWAWSLLGLAGMIYGFAVFAQTHPQYFIFMHK